MQNTALMIYLKTLRPRPTVRGKVTIVTATFRRPDALKEAIQSVRAQTYSNWEHIIVCDGRDRTVERLVQNIGDPRIRALSTWPFHIIGTYQKNYALLHADGEFVLYLDDDNVVEPHCLATMTAGFESDRIGYVVCPVRYGESGIMAPKPDFKVQEIDTLNFMIRRDLVEKTWGWGPRYSADYRLIKKVSGMAPGTFLDVVIGHHR